MFNIQGELKDDGRRVVAAWDVHGISGDERFCEDVRALAEAYEGEPVGPPEGPYTTTRHLSDPLTAFVIMSRFLKLPTIRVSGFLPPRPAIPDDAIG